MAPDLLHCALLEVRRLGVIEGENMTHREFLLWLGPRLQNGTSTGIESAVVRDIREELERMREVGALQPFASRLLALVRARATLDADTVAQLAGGLRFELAPPREATVVLSSLPDTREE
jgi:hypothetical protein